MKVRDCEKCKYYKRRTYSIRRKPMGYHAIGQTFAYGYCTKMSQRCSMVKQCKEGADANHDAQN